MLKALSKLQREKCDDIETSLKDLEGVEVIATGSIVSGHHVGQKHRMYSLNRHSPFELSHEIDIRILVSSEQMDSPSVLREIKIACGAHFVGAPLVSDRYGVRKVVRYLYSYEVLENVGAIEWEYTINTRPYFDLAAAYPIVFSREEISFQSKVRDLVRSRKLTLHGRYNPLKQIQAQECIWRCVSALAIRKANIGLPIPSEIYDLRGIEMLDGLADQWLLGQWGIIGVDRPDFEFYAGLLSPSLSLSVIKIPLNPRWVTEALEIQAQRRDDAIVIEN